MEVDLLVTPEQFRAHIAPILKLKKVIAEVITRPSDDPQDGYSPGSTKIHKLTNQEAIDHAVRAYCEVGTLHCVPKTYVSRLPNTDKEVLEYVAYSFAGDGEWAMCNIFTPKEYRQKIEKHEREECESIAAGICNKYKVLPGTVAFIRAAVRHYRELVRAERDFRENPETQAERYASYFDKNNYYEDNDYSRSQEMSIRDQAKRLIRYIQRNCPLLWTKYKEAKERKRGGENQD